MEANLNTENPSEQGMPWGGLIKFAWAIVLTVVVYLVAHGMENHRFFRGGSIDHHQSVR